MTEVGSADLSKLLQIKRNEFSSIVTARKRKLRELYAVATNVDSIPHDAFSNPSVPPPTQSESQFLESNDLLQTQTFDIATLPSRPEPAVHFFVNSLTKLLFPPPVDNQQPNVSTPQNHGASDPTAPNQTPSATAKAASVVGSEGRDTRASSAASPHSIPAETKSSVSSSSTSTTVAGSDARLATPGTSQGAVTAHSIKPANKPTSPETEKNGVKPVSLSPEGGAATPNGGSPSATAPSGINVDNGKVSDAAATSNITTMDNASATTNTAPVPMDLTASEAEVPVPALVKEQKQIADAATKPTTNPTEIADETTGNTAEDQLLQESLRSSMVPESHTKTVDPSPTAIAATGAAPEPSTSTPTTTSATQARPMEIPDSQEEDRDRMAIDVPSQEVPSVPTNVASSVPNQASGSAPEDVARDSTEQPQRAVTRVSSGAMRLKSVSEIVGDTPKGGSHERTGVVDIDSQLTPLTSTSQSPSVRFRGRPQSRGQASTVLFGSKPKRAEDKVVVSTEPEKILPEDDYFTPLFVQGFTNTSSWMPSMEKLLHQANKTIGTPDALLALQDHQACKVLRRVYHLQQNDKWSLRQPKRCPEPTRQATQWDVLLKEVKWMRTDFREERKWKMAAARRLAQACAEWVNSTPEVRTEMQVAAHIPPVAQDPIDDVDMVATVGEADQAPTPDLVPSGDADSPQAIDDLIDFPETVAPSAIFALQEDDVVFGLRPSPAADRLLDELPMYGPPLTVPKVDAFNPDFDPDAHWRRPALPLSKYVEGEMKIKAHDRNTKKRRFNYQDEAADEDHFFSMDTEAHTAMLPPASDDVSLFNPDMKHTRDRLHTGHHFRPPSDSSMPLQHFYECRSPSQWTQSEDDELRSLVREFTYNWPLISNMLSNKSRYKSGAERRTPWECFERWINLEGLPADMGRTAYFKAYNNRIEAAQRVIMHQNQLAVQAASQSGGTVTPMRRRPSTPIKVERRRNNKHLAMIDAMRKLAKKREATAQKQQQQKEAIHEKNEKEKQQQAAQGGKKPGDNLHGKKQTPREYSLLRAEREQVMQDRIAQYALAQEQKRRVSTSQAPGSRQGVDKKQAALQQARAQQQGQTGQAAGVQGQNGQVHPQNGQQMNHAGGVNGVNGMQRPPANHVAAAAAAAAAAAQQGRPRMAMQGQANGMANGMNNGLNGMPNGMANGIVNGNVQAYMNNAMGGQVGQMNGQSQQHLQAALQAHQQQQRLQQSQAQQQHHQQQRQMGGNQQQPDPSVMLRAQRMAEQQRQAQAQQQLHNTQHHAQPHQQNQHQQHQQLHQQQGQVQQNNPGTPGSQGTQGSPPLRNGAANLNQQSFINNAQAMLAQYNHNNNNGANGNQGSPPANGMHMPSLAASSPGQGQAQGQGQARHQPQIPNSITTQLAQLEASYRAKNPSLTQEQLRQLATENLTRAMMQQRQSAMNAAAGGAAAMAAPQTAGIANGLAATTSPHQYAALLRQQQQQQASQGQAQGAQSASPVPQATQIAHQRQSSEGSATPSGLTANGISPNGVK